MKTCLPCAVISLLALPSAVVAAPERAVTIHIRVLDGHSGKPIVGHTVIPRIEPLRAHPVENAPVTDAGGSIILTIPTNTRLNAIVSRYPTCRHVPKSDRTKGPITFALDQILSTGVVEANSCSQRTVAPTPGELTLFVRPLHWWERLSD